MYSTASLIGQDLSLSVGSCLCFEQQEDRSLPSLCGVFGGHWEKGKKGRVSEGVIEF